MKRLKEPLLIEYGQRLKEPREINSSAYPHPCNDTAFFSAKVQKFQPIYMTTSVCAITTQRWFKIKSHDTPCQSNSCRNSP